MQFDPETVREIMWQGMTEDEYRNAQEPIEEVFDEAGRSCVRLLWVALHWQASLVKKAQVANATSNLSFIEAVINFFSIKRMQLLGLTKWTEDKLATSLTHHQKIGATGQQSKTSKSEKKSSDGAISSKVYTRCMKSKIVDVINTDHRS